MPCLIPRVGVRTPTPGLGFCQAGKSRLGDSVTLSANFYLASAKTIKITFGAGADSQEVCSRLLDRTKESNRRHEPHDTLSSGLSDGCGARP